KPGSRGRQPSWSSLSPKRRRPPRAGSPHQRNVTVLKDFTWDSHGPNLVFEADNADVLPRLPENTFRLIYIDPPFNTGKTQRRQSMRTPRPDGGTRVGFKGHTYENHLGPVSAYADTFDYYW